MTHELNCIQGRKFLYAILLIQFLITGCKLTHPGLVFGPELVPTRSEISLSSELPRASGWNQAKLQSAMSFMDSAGTTSVIIIHNGELVAEWGETDKVSSLHSVRKSIVSSLYGIAIEKGLIDISLTLEELGLDDRNPPLTKQEKSARLEDLLTSRSGIYHPSIKDDNGPYPTPGSHPPNTHFFYNNWSFNAVGSIFEQLTNLKLGEAFEKWIANPTGMEDFKAKDVRYQKGKKSVFPAYRFWMSGRDLARYALLYTNQGMWRGKQIIPLEWLNRSLTRYSGNEDQVAYGYMWWIMPSGVYLATGTGGQKIWIDPKNNILIVNRVNTGKGFGRAAWWTSGVRVNNSHMRKLSRMILEARLDDS